MQTERILLPSRRWAEARVWPNQSHSESNQLHVIVVPGNPGIAEFYIPFCEKLHASFEGRISVRSVNLAGFVAAEHRTVITHQAAAQPAAAAATAANANANATDTASQTDTASAVNAVNGGGASSASCGPHTHTHEMHHRQTYTLQQQGPFLFEYLRALQLQLQCVDALSQGESFPPHELLPPNFDVTSLLSPCIPRPAKGSISATRKHTFVLVCHSIGAYIGLHAMNIAEDYNTAFSAANPASSQSASSQIQYFVPYISSTNFSPNLPLAPVNITHSFLLFPFIRMDLTRFQVFTFRILFFLRPLLRLLVLIWKYLPESMWAWGLKMAAGIVSRHAVQAVINTYTNSDLADEAISLAITEFNDVKRQGERGDLSAAWLKRHVQHLTVYYAGAEHDIWAPIVQKKAFEREVPSLNAFVEPKAVHAWCAYIDQSHLMAQHVERELKQINERLSKDDAKLDARNTDRSAAVGNVDAPRQVSRL